MAAKSISVSHWPAWARWGMYFTLAILFALVCIWLSQWQFSRNDSRSAQIELVAQNYDAPIVPIAEILPEEQHYQDELRYRTVSVTGHYLAQEQLLVRNRPHGGTSSFEILVPFVTTDGETLLINRGWVPPASNSPLPDSIPAPPVGEVTITARVSPSEPLPNSGRGAPHGQLPTIHVPSVRDEVPINYQERFRDDAYFVLSNETPAPAHAANPIPAPSQDPGPHLSYAIQWILFAVMGFAFIFSILRTELKTRKLSDKDREQFLKDREKRRAKRRDRDAETEDQLSDLL